MDKSNCDYRSVGSSLMAAHLQKIHKIGEEKKVECEVCGKHYASEHYVRLHIQVSSLARFYSSFLPSFFVTRQYILVVLELPTEFIFSEIPQEMDKAKSEDIRTQQKKFLFI